MQESSLLRYKNGVKTWNKWADKQIASKKTLIKKNLWIDSPDPSMWNCETRKWHRESNTDFSDHVFNETADFIGFRFPGRAEFGRTTFKDRARFQESTFHERARFQGAQFHGRAKFDDATFCKDAIFHYATFFRSAGFEETVFYKMAKFKSVKFKYVAWFEKAKFYGEALFRGTMFSGFTTFQCCKFFSAASFTAIEGRTAFKLDDAEFRFIPNFNQAHFIEAPDLHPLSEVPNLSEPSDPNARKAEKIDVKDPTIPARWRSLKRLASIGHDHALERKFFRKELIARRTHDDVRFDAVYCFSWLYQIFSNFGSSLLLPLFWLSASILLSASIYFSAHRDILDKNRQLYQTNTFTYSAGPPKVGESGAPATCTNGKGNSVLAALTLATQKGIFPGVTLKGNTERLYRCLFDAPSENRQGLGSNQLSVPDSVTWLEMFQFGFSIVMLFLFGLAARNHFRIK